MMRIVKLLVFGLLIFPISKAQQLFYSQSLQNLYYSLPEGCKVETTSNDRVALCCNIVQGDTLPVVFVWDENNVLEHIGYRFLPNNDELDENNVIVRFVERELLAMLTTRNINQTLISYRENGLSILLNKIPVKQNFLQNKRNLLNLVKNNQGIVINFDGNSYDVLILCQEGQELSFHFKADSELLTGMDKKERDIRLAFQLKNHDAKQNGVTTSPDYSYLQLLRDSIYIDKGNSFMIPQINNDLVYVKTDSVYNLALDKSLIAESFANALLVPVGNDYEIEITHKMYGKIKEEFTVRSRDFDDYFSRGFDRYFGIESLEKEKLTGTLILSDRNAGSIHLGYVSVSLEDLLNGGTIEMELYSNIPQQNLKSLFGE